MSSNTEPHYTWVRSIGRAWIGYLDFTSSIAMLLGVVFAAAGGMLKVDWLMFAGLSLLLVSVCSMVLYWFLFYRFIKCPVCGYNPTRTKDGRKRKNHRATETIISRLSACPKCVKSPVNAAFQEDQEA